MHIAIVEDELHMQEQLSAKLYQWKTSHKLSMDISVFDSGTDFLNSAESEHYQIVFMDIYLKEESGIDIAMQYRKLDMMALLIFLTGSQNHMREAFPCRAFDYLLKPVEDQDLFHTLDEAMKTFLPLDRTLSIPKGDNALLIHYDDIRFVTAQRNYCLVEAVESITYRTTFSALSEELSNDPRFCTINRGILVNLDWVDLFDHGVCLMKDGKQFPLHTKKQAQLMQRLIDYRFHKRDAQMRRMWND